MSAPLTLPRDTTRQADRFRHADIGRVLHRVSGTILTLFVLVHVAVQMVRKVPAFASLDARVPWLVPLQQQGWIHALLFFSVAFHTLYGLKLMAGDIGMRIDHRRSLWTIVVLSVIAAAAIVLWEGTRHVQA
ncbi:MAG: hypothetical protein M3Z31_19380 [Pseudomonadota bacterium]|nr:hypothetical protein [Pseudomonadota bacterium]